MSFFASKMNLKFYYIILVKSSDKSEVSRWSYHFNVIDLKFSSIFARSLHFLKACYTIIHAKNKSGS